MKTLLKLTTALTLVAWLGACASLVTPLITPKVKTEVASLKPGQYSVDKAHATVLFKVQHLGLATYVGRFNEFDAQLEFDPANIADTRLTATIEMQSLDLNDDDFEDDLMGGNWFNQKVYPQARFSTLRVEVLEGNTFLFTGELDWRGIKKPMDMRVTFNGGANNVLTGKYTLGFDAIGTFKRSDFNMSDFIPLVGDEVTIEAYAEFQKN